MPTMNDDLIGGDWKPEVAFPLGSIDDSELPPHLPSDTLGVKKNKEASLKFECPIPSCRAVFVSEEELQHHQWRRLHYRCVSCEIDYPDQEGIDRHNRQVHRQPQELICPGCGIECVRATELMSHVERNHCPKIAPSMLDERRKWTMEFSDGLRRMNPANAELTLTGDISNLKKISGLDNPQTKAGIHPPHAKPDARILNFGLLTRLSDEPSTDLKDYRNGYTSQPDLLTGDALQKHVVHPALSVENRWESGLPLYPYADPVPRPPPRQLGTLTAVASSARDIRPNDVVTNPDDPRFKATAFYVPILKDFRCPYAPRCKKRSKTAKGLVAHLKSRAHRPHVVFKCPNCFHELHSMTSALAHAEDATGKCKLHKTEQFREFINHVTGGMIDGLNSEEDCLKYGLPRFTVPKAFYERLRLPAHIKKKLEKTEKFGRGRMAEWVDSEDNDCDDDE
ncbi:hypothetical protein AB5N19_13741 [Seiridium cardinale]|uniref:C2H2-type domain-containing protein n=1 Tax=Seiridium cardinale TaxID=138064 RepID=A0ABR2XKL9_9PEZI